MANFYFTFGSHKRFPYQNGYIIVFAKDYGDAVSTFRDKYPDVHNDCINCSDIYDEDQWDRINRYYTKEHLKEVLVSKNAYTYTDEELFKMKKEYLKYHTVEDPDGNEVTNPEDIPDDWILNAIDRGIEDSLRDEYLECVNI